MWFLHLPAAFHAEHMNREIVSPPNLDMCYFSVVNNGAVICKYPTANVSKSHCRNYVDTLLLRFMALKGVFPWMHMQQGQLQKSPCPHVPGAKISVCLFSKSKQYFCNDKKWFLPGGNWGKSWSFPKYSIANCFSLIFFLEMGDFSLPHRQLKLQITLPYS